MSWAPGGDGRELPCMSTAGVNLQPQGCEGLHLRVGRHSLFSLVAAELAANEVFHIQWRHCLEDLDLFVPNGFAVVSERRFHDPGWQGFETNGSAPHRESRPSDHKRRRVPGSRNLPPW